MPLGFIFVQIGLHFGGLGVPELEEDNQGSIFFPLGSILARFWRAWGFQGSIFPPSGFHFSSIVESMGLLLGSFGAFWAPI